jgi:hypothetical protein
MELSGVGQTCRRSNHSQEAIRVRCRGFSFILLELLHREPINLDFMKVARLEETKPTILFSARLFRPEATEEIGSRCVLTLPKDASAELPASGMTMFEGTINGFPFRAALEPNDKGSHSLRVNKAMQDAAGASIGDTVRVEITRIGEEKETRVPTDLRKALGDVPLAQALWAEITPMARRDWDSLDKLSQTT